MEQHNSGQVVIVSVAGTGVGTVTAAIDGVAERFGRPHVLVSNAGIAIPGIVDQTDADSYRTTVKTNLDGVFFASRTALSRDRRRHRLPRRPRRRAPRRSAHRRGRRPTASDGQADLLKVDN